MIERLSIAKSTQGFHIADFPKAEKLLNIMSIEDKKLSGLAHKLSDLTLCRQDLQSSLDFLEAINKPQNRDMVVQAALWQTAMLSYLKCFGENKARQRTLQFGEVYKGEPPEAKEAFDSFKIMRNKHIVHDENAHSQSITGAVLNKEESSHKIEKIVNFCAQVSTLEQGSYSNLHLLVTKALRWIEEEYDRCCDQLKTELETIDRAKLLEIEELSYSKPNLSEIKESRYRKC